MLDFTMVTMLIMGVVEGVKKLGLMPVKFLPLLAVILGSVAYVFFLPEVPLRESIFWGISTGGAACGLFSAIKNVGEGLK